jgi:hypothetical protein
MLFSSRISDIYRRTGYHPDGFGIEIEVESKEALAKPWSSQYSSLKGDGSLRNVGMELVSTPLVYKDLPAFYEDYQILLSKIGDNFVPTKRTSVHVHMDVSQMSLIQMWNLMSVYYLVEKPLVSTAGEGRSGNLFAQTLDENLGLVKVLSSFLKRDVPVKFRENERYFAMNMASLGRFGTLEFRSHCGTKDTKDIHDWVTTIREIRDFSLTFKTPSDVMKEFSENTNEAFIQKNLPSLYKRGPSEKSIVQMDYSYELVSDILTNQLDDWDVSKDPRNDPMFKDYKKRKSDLEWLLSTPRAEIQKLLLNKGNVPPPRIEDYIDEGEADGFVGDDEAEDEHQVGHLLRELQDRANQIRANPAAWVEDHQLRGNVIAEAMVDQAIDPPVQVGNERAPGDFFVQMNRAAPPQRPDFAEIARMYRDVLDDAPQPAQPQRIPRGRRNPA